MMHDPQHPQAYRRRLMGMRLTELQAERDEIERQVAVLHRKLRVLEPILEHLATGIYEDRFDAQQ